MRLIAVAMTAALVSWGASRAGAQALGDANCDGRVDEGDLTAVASALFDADGSRCGGADVNLDWILSGADTVAAVREQARTAVRATGPSVGFFGLAAPDGSVMQPIGEAQGIPVYYRNSGFGFRIVVEGNSGSNDIRPGTGVFLSGAGNHLLRPDLQLLSSRPLGDGSPAVCDGGIVAIDPPNFGSGQGITNALNDIACNALAATAAAFACTQDVFGTQGFVTPRPFVQFCVTVARDRVFPPGETLLTVRLRDLLGQLGPERHLIVRIGEGPPPPTFTRTPTMAPASPSPTRTHTPTATVPPTATLSPRPSATWTETAISVPTATSTMTGAVDRSATPTRPPVSVTPTATGPTRTATRTPVFTATPTASMTATRSRTPSPTATTAVVPIGPVVTYFGLVYADDSPMPTASIRPDGTPVFQVLRGLSFAVVVEAKFGISGQPVGCSSFRDPFGDPLACSFREESPLPDLQIVSSQPLGNGSAAVCDSAGAFAGGVPAVVDLPLFGENNAAAINDLACRFVDGGGQPLRRIVDDGCVKRPPTDDYGFMAADSWLQFCSIKVNRSIEFPPGDTMLTARLRDVEGNVGPVARIIIRVGA